MSSQGIFFRGESVAEYVIFTDLISIFKIEIIISARFCILFVLRRLLSVGCRKDD
jgi:hypothetical protein